jgi:hypothetical protein
VGVESMSHWGEEGVRQVLFFSVYKLIDNCTTLKHVRSRKTPEPVRAPAGCATVLILWSHLATEVSACVVAEMADNVS